MINYKNRTLKLLEKASEEEMQTIWAYVHSLLKAHATPEVLEWLYLMSYDLTHAPAKEIEFAFHWLQHSDTIRRRKKEEAKKKKTQ